MRYFFQYVASEVVVGWREVAEAVREAEARGRAVWVVGRKEDIGGSRVVDGGGIEGGMEGSR